MLKAHYQCNPFVYQYGMLEKCNHHPFSPSYAACHMYTLLNAAYVGRYYLSLCRILSFGLLRASTTNRKGNGSMDCHRAAFSRLPPCQDINIVAEHPGSHHCDHDAMQRPGSYHRDHDAMRRNTLGHNIVIMMQCILLRDGIMIGQWGRVCYYNVK